MARIIVLRMPTVGQTGNKPNFKNTNAIGVNGIKRKMTHCWRRWSLPSSRKNNGNCGFEIGNAKEESTAR